ncbi:MAG: hypothetical protein JNM56_03090 [Planctomycetia bacterium]|nr:hypothetical protein [Planctomycetia bacterium]
MNALASTPVGAYINEHFVATFVKVGTFTVANGNKQGGNVASYFCLHDGTVLHAIAGPVNAETFLREARWAVETRKLALFHANGHGKTYQTALLRSHAERLTNEYGIPVDNLYRAWSTNINLRMHSTFDSFALMHGGQRHHGGKDAGGNLARMHLLLYGSPGVKVERIYQYVFEKVLNEKISTLPVVQK